MSDEKVIHKFDDSQPYRIELTTLDGSGKRTLFAPSKAGIKRVLIGECYGMAKIFCNLTHILIEIKLSKEAWRYIRFRRKCVRHSRRGKIAL